MSSRNPNQGVVAPDALAIPISFSLPPLLQEWASMNKASTIIKAVKEAVLYSLEHEDTKMRVLTHGEVKRRVDICLNYLQIAYAGIEGITMTQLCDVMPHVLVETLRTDYHFQSVAADTTQGAMWCPTLAKDKVSISELDSDLEGEPDPEIVAAAEDTEKVIN